MALPSQPEPDFSALVASVVLAGGRGKRLEPLTLTRCKPSVSFAGRYRLIDIPISNSLNSQIRQIFVLSQYFSNELSAHVSDSYQTDLFQQGGIEVLTPEETSKGRIWFQGTADAVRKNLDTLLDTSAEYFVILSGDQLYKMDLRDFVLHAMDTDADLVIAAQPVPYTEASRMGLLRTDDKSQILEFVEKPTDLKVLDRFRVSGNAEAQCLGSMGIYVFKRDALTALLKEEGDDFGKDLIPKQLAKGKTYAYTHEGYWEDIGTIRSYYNANIALIADNHRLDFHDQQNPIFTYSHHLPSPLIDNSRVTKSIISQGSIVRADEISGSVIGVRTHIDTGTIIRDSILIGNHKLRADKFKKLEKYHPYRIGCNCQIEKAIIDEGVNIGDNVRLVNEKGLDTYDGDGIYIRDGIIIVSSGTTIPDGFSL